MLPIFVPAAEPGGRFIRYAALFGPRAGRLSWTPQRPASDPQKWTRAFWFKRSRPRVAETMFGAGGSNPDELRFDTEGRLDIVSHGGAVLQPDRRFRDITGWMHWHEEYDSAAHDAGLRRRVWINGVEQTAWAVDNRARYIAHNAAEPRFLQNGTAHGIGSAASGAAPAGVYIAAFTALDGAAPGGPDGVTAKTNAYGVWVPAGAAGLDFGANGFLLDFSKAPGDGGGLGADVSGRENHWTAQGVSAPLRARTHNAPARTHDAPATNAEDGRASWATLNPLLPGRGPYMSEGALRADQPRSVYYEHNSLAAIADLAGGKWYWEVEVIKGSTSYPETGVWSSSAGAARFDPRYSLGSYSFRGCGIGLGPRNSSGMTVIEDGVRSYDTSSTWVQPTGDGGRGMAAVDLDAGKIWFGKNGVWLGGGDPGAGTNPAEDRLNVAKYTYTPFLTGYNTSAVMHFGQFGFAYSPPAGFKALNTVNLPRPRIEDVNELFRAVHAPAASAPGALADLRAGWADYAELFKTTDAVSPWRLRFSHDAAHEYTWGDTRGAAAATSRHARRALLGAAMTAGYAIRTGPRFGTAAGSVRHTHGTATTVTHNLGDARGVIMLFRRTGTNEAPLHHPDCDAGKLLAFGRSRSQAALDAVTNVTADAFDIGAQAPADDYDYLVLTPASGCFAAGHYHGNSWADGPYAYLGLRPVFVCVIPDRAGHPGTVTDSVRCPANPARRALILETNSAEGAYGGDKDLLAAGFKMRTSDSRNNYSGVKHFVFAFGQPLAIGAQAK